MAPGAGSTDSPGRTAMSRGNPCLDHTAVGRRSPGPVRLGILGLRKVTPSGSTGCISMKFAICQELFENWDWERQCKFIAQVGYEGIEVAPFTLAPRITDLPADRRATLRKQAADCGLQ